MDTTTVYNQKAETYARYRWDYAPLAIETIFNMVMLNSRSTVADLGAGTGILTRHFYGRVGHIYAVEPNAEMRTSAMQDLPEGSNSEWIDACAEATSLPTHSVDLITSATSLRWFEPASARQEFRRILKPGGWLAVLWNRMTNDALGHATAELCKPEYGFDSAIRLKRPEWKPIIYYFGSGRFQCVQFEFSFTENFDRFFGATLSTAGMPHESHPRFADLKAAAREVFERFSTNGMLETRGITELYIGQVSGIQAA